jgi:predicted dehydrogenase
MVGFNYRRVPAVELARRLIADGRLGVIRHVRAVYLQDWIVDPDFPLVWRLRKELAGSGALGDIGAHIVDLSQHLLGDLITSVCGTTETFVKERPLPGGAGRGEVTVDDAALFLARFAGGAVATFEASRFATGRKNGLRIEINGSLGSLAFDLERLNELEVYESGDSTSGFRRVLVTEADHPWIAAWWPPGHVLGWEHTFTNQARDLLVAIADGVDCAPTFADGLHVQKVLDAVLRSSDEGGWASP